MNRDTLTAADYRVVFGLDGRPGSEGVIIDADEQVADLHQRQIVEHLVDLVDIEMKAAKETA